MKDFDFCKNSVTLTAEQRDFANTAIRKKLNEVTELYDRFQPDGNLYLGGSLGIRQPAIVIENGQPIGLKSDLDFYLITPGLAGSPALQSFLEGIATLTGEVEVSIQFQPAFEIDKPLYNVTLDELARSLSHPIRRTFDLPPNNVLKNVHPKTLAYFACGGLGKLIAPYYVATHEYANVPGDKIFHDSYLDAKMSLVFLRFLTYGKLPGRLTIADLAVSVSEGHYDAVSSQESILDLIRRREQFDPNEAPPELDHFDLFRRIIAAERSLPASTPILKLYDVFCAEHFADHQAMDSLHSLLLAVALWILDGEPTLRDRAARERASSRFLEIELPQDFLDALDAWLSAEDPSKDDATDVVTLLIHECMNASVVSVRRAVEAYYSSRN